MEQILLVDISNKHVKDKKVFGISQHGFRKGRSRLINLIAFYSEMDWLSG